MKVARAEIPGSDHLPRVINPPGLGAGREKRCRIDVLHAAVTVQKFLGIEVRVGITPVQISCLTAFPTLKSLGIAQLWAWTCSYASAQAEVSASRGLVRLLSELLGHIPPEINVASSDRFSAVQLLPTRWFQVVAHRHAPRPGPAGPEKDRPATPTDRDRTTVAAAAARPASITTTRTSISTAGTSAPASRSTPSTPACAPHWRWSPQTF